MKSILISIHPEWVEKIANGIKKLEIRRSKPRRELPIDALIYCTNGDKELWLSKNDRRCFTTMKGHAPFTLVPLQEAYYHLNGKVVGKFRLKKVEEFVYGNAVESVDEECVEAKLNHHDFDQLLKQAAMTREQLEAYAPIHFYAWYISDLEIFDEPKQLEDFYSTDATKFKGIEEMAEESKKKYQDQFYKIKSAPQSWRYVEVEE